MEAYKIIAIVMIMLLLSACLDTENSNSTQNNSSVTKLKSAELNEDEKLLRQQKVYAEAAAEPKQFRQELKENCPHFNSILLTTAETIQLGTRVFNAGGTSLTNRIYEGTVYKILFIIQGDCMDLSDALQAGLAMANEKESYADKAWALRNTLDLIMGGPPIQPPGV